MSEEENKSDDGGQKTGSRKNKTQLSWPVVIGVCACFVILYAVLLEIGPPSVRRLASEIMCGTHMSALGKALIVYANDNDDRFPTPDKWCDLLIEHVDAVPKIFICPQSDTVYGESSYAMNFNLIGKKIDEVPADTVMVFETDLGKEAGQRKELVSSREFFEFLSLSETEGKQKVYGGRWNQVGGPIDVTLEHHKGEGCNVLFVDGHVEFEKSIDGLRWEVNEVTVESEAGVELSPDGLIE